MKATPEQANKTLTEAEAVAAIKEALANINSQLDKIKSGLLERHPERLSYNDFLKDADDKAVIKEVLWDDSPDAIKSLQELTNHKLDSRQYAPIVRGNFIPTPDGFAGFAVIGAVTWSEPSTLGVRNAEQKTKQVNIGDYVVLCADGTLSVRSGDTAQHEVVNTNIGEQPTVSTDDHTLRANTQETEDTDPILRASDLIIELQEAVKQHGDLHVRVWADHGQEYMGIPKGDISVCHLHKDDGMEFLPDVYHEDDIEDGDKDIIKQLVIHSIA